MLALIRPPELGMAWTSVVMFALIDAAEESETESTQAATHQCDQASLRGDQFLARGFSVHETCLRQGVDLWGFMHKAEHAFIANTLPPRLMPRTGPPGGARQGDHRRPGPRCEIGERAAAATRARSMPHPVNRYRNGPTDRLAPCSQSDQDCVRANLGPPLPALPARAPDGLR
jgi:hypothetical protein